MSIASINQQCIIKINSKDEGEKVLTSESQWNTKLRSTINQLLAILLIVLLTGIAINETVSKTDFADAIYYNGDILTMESDLPVYVEAIAVKDGKIISVGKKSEIEKLKGDNTLMNDLKGKTMLPGFIDPHSHFTNSLSMSDQANCSPPPVGNGKDIEGILASLKDFRDRNNVPKGELIIGYGYDDGQMPGGRLLNRDDLDKDFPDNPVMVMHVSLHGAVLNSLALKKFGYSKETITPEGGIIVRHPETNEPYGLIMETAFMQVFANLPRPTSEKQREQLKAGQMIYAEAGVTTAQDGATHKADFEIFEKGARDKDLFIDVVAYPFILELPAIFKEYPLTDFGTYKDRLKIGGVKITMDGSPQGRTAFFTVPYLTGGPGGEENWKGEPTFPQDSLNRWVKWLYDNNIQMIAHGNGDAAIDMILQAHEFASGSDLSRDRRTTIIHSQFVRKDQLEKYKIYNIIPSFYTEHTFFFGDTHIKNRGLEQASFISPLNTAYKMGIAATNHTDFNVLPIDQMLVIWSAVNRITRNGVLLGPEERVTPYDALKAITINAARQYSEEENKGSIKEGKLADLVILDKNPLKVEPMEIKDIKVMETIKEGKVIFKK